MREEHHVEVVGAGYRTTSQDTPYDELAMAIIKQAVKDYVKVIRKLWDKKVTVIQKRNLMLEKADLEGFFNSGWYEWLTDINPDKLMAQCRVIAKEKEKQAIEKRNKAAIKKLLEEQNKKNKDA